MIETDLKYITRENLGTLHFQTREWIEEVDFYHDELLFLSNVMLNKIISQAACNTDYNIIFNAMNEIVPALSVDIKAQLVAHEKYLYKLQALKQQFNGKEYIEFHSKIAKKLSSVKSEIRELKRNIFKYVNNNTIGTMTIISDEF